MKKGFDEATKNELRVSLDWLSFTDKEHIRPEFVVKLLGYTMEDFADCARGRYGYQRMARSSSGICVLWNGRDGMGVHVDCPGSSIADLLSAYQRSRTDGLYYETDSFDGSIMADLFRDIRRIGQITRLDLAVDDIGNRFLSVLELRELLQNNGVITKFRRFRFEESGTFAHPERGATLYFGVRSSDIMIRVYDKQYEQNQKNLDSEKPLVDTPWTRWEIELKNDYADKVGGKLAHDMEIQEIAVGILANYIRVIDLDSSVDRYRCAIHPAWEAFIDGIRKVSLFVSRAASTIDQTLAWVKKQWPRTAYKLSLALDDGFDWFFEILERGRNRLTTSDLLSIADFSGN